MKKTALIALLLLCASTALAQQSQPRMNWQCLSPGRKAQFVDALKVMNGRDQSKDSWDHPYENSLTWYQNLHNGVGSGGAYCTHRSERFLTWHRAMLVIFERALRIAAKDTTVTLPYWNWTRYPTGKHYPVEFETDPFLIAKRDNSQPQRIRWSEQQVTEIVDKNKTWVSFAGPAAGYGALEGQRHNEMHTWVGGDRSGPMFVDTTAARDPLFWLFHCYIDAIFDRWQRKYNFPAVACPNCPLNQLPNWTPAQTNHTEDLGYVYDTKVCEPAEPPRTRFSAPLAAEMLEAAPASREIAPPAHVAGQPYIFDVAIPEYGFESAELRIEGAEFPPDITYDGTAYLFPAEVAFKPDDPAFARRYRVDRFSVWSHNEASAEHAGHASEGDLYVNATTELQYLAKTNPDGRWKGAIVIDDIYSTKRDLTASEAAEARRGIHFDGVSIELNRGEEGRP